MPDVKLMSRTDKSLAHGKVTMRLPEVTVRLPSKQELAHDAAVIIEKRLRERLGSVPSRWKGFARWLASNLSVNGNVVEWPESEAAERLGAMDIDARWLDEALEAAVKDAIR